MEIMKHYLEYRELMDDWSHADLKRAWDAINCSELQDELYEEESPLMAFLIDTSLQEKLYLYFEDFLEDQDKRLYDE